MWDQLKQADKKLADEMFVKRRSVFSLLASAFSSSSKTGDAVHAND
jgi:hypothetical protein